MKKATKKQAKKPAKKVSANEKMVAVRSASDMEALYDSGCSGIHMVTGYTIHIEADTIKLEGAVCFKDCTLVNPSNMTINGTIVTTGALHMESCTLNGLIDVQTGQGLFVVDVQGGKKADLRIEHCVTLLCPINIAKPAKNVHYT